MKHSTHTLIGLFLVLAALQLNAQTYVNQEWVKVHGAPDTIEWTTSTTNLWGQVVTTGNTVTAGQHANILTVVYDGDAGGIFWQQQWDGPQNSSDYGAAVITDQNGNVFVAGASHYTTDSTFDIVLLKYDWQGNLQWSSNYNGSGKNNYPVAIALDENGFIYITGASEGASSNLDFVTLKFDPSGQLEWDVTYDYKNGVDIAASIVVSEGGETVTITGGSEVSNGNWDYTTVMYDIDGNEIGVDRQPSDETDIRKPKDLVKDSDKNYYITGVELNADYDIKLIKLDSTLLPQWVQVYNSGSNESSNALHIDPSGNLYIGGWVEEAPGIRRFLVIKYDNDGNLQWETIISPNPSMPHAEITDIKFKDNRINIIGFVSDGFTSDIVTGQLGIDGGINWLRTWEGVGGSIDYPTSVNAIGNSVFVSGKTQTQNGLQWVTVKYSFYERDVVIATDTSGFKYQANELVIQFHPSVVLGPAINNRGKTYGYLSDFIQESTIHAMNASLEQSLDQVMAFKVFPRMTPADSLSVTRLGDTITLHHFWTTLIVELPVSVYEQFAASQFNDLQSHIYFSELNLVFELDDLPDDPQFVAGNQAGLQGNINNDIRMDRAWDVYHGTTSARVGIYDTGLQWSHEDFGGGTFATSKIVGGWDYVGNVHISNATNNGDPHGHGTSVAGIVGAIRNNDLGVAGIAGGNGAANNTGCQLFGFRILPFNNQGALTTAANALVEGSASWGYGLHVLQNSWGIPNTHNLYTQNNRNLFYQTNRTVFRNHAVLVYSRGNENENQPRIPSTIGPDEFKISVGASDATGARATQFSNWGHEMDIIAPGVGALVTTTGLNNTYVQFGGTSAAAPHVSGVAALMISYILDHPTPNPLAPEDVEFLIQRYASTPQGWAPGYHDEIGWGRLNAGETMEHLVWPFFLVQHGTASVSASNATLVQSNVVRTTSNVGNLPNANYIVDVYEVNVNIPHNIGNYSIINSWRRNGSSNLWANAQPIIPEVNVELTNVTGTQAQMRGYIYHIKTNMVGQQVNQWYPFNLNGTAQLAYTIHLHDPNATSVNEVSMAENRVKLFPNPTGSHQYLEILIEKPTDVTVTLMDVTGRIVRDIYSGKMEDSMRISSDLTGLANGIYFYRVKTGEQVTTIKSIKY